MRGECACAGVNECTWMEQIPRLGSFGTYQNVQKTRGSFQHPPKVLAVALALPSRPPDRTPIMSGVLHLGVSRAGHPLRADFASWQLWSNFFCSDAPWLCLVLLRRVAETFGSASLEGAGILG